MSARPDPLAPDPFAQDAGQAELRELVDGGEVHAPEAVRAALRGVLDRDEFRPRTPTWRDWIADRASEFFDWLGDAFGVKGTSIVSALLWVVGALAAAGLVWLAVDFVRRRRAAGPAGARGATAADARAARAAEILALARDARARGDLAAALRHYFTALVIGLSERGEVEYRDAWTYRELLERGAPRHDVRGALAPLVPRLDAVSFGHAPAAELEVEALDDLCRRWLGGRSA